MMIFLIEEAESICVFSQVTLGSCAELSLKTIREFSSLVAAMPDTMDYSLTPYPRENLPGITRCGDRRRADEAVSDLEVKHHYLYLRMCL